MKLKMNWAIAGYIFSGIAMLVVFLYLRFPGETVKTWVKARAVVLYPEMLLSIDTAEPSIPPGLLLGNITAASQERPEATFHTDRLVIRPGWLSALRGRFAFVLGAEGYGGTLKGRIDFAEKFSWGGPVSVETHFRDIRTEKCAWLRDTLARQIAGTLKGSATLVFGRASETQKGRTGDIEFSLTNGTYPLQESFFGFDRIDFSKVEAKISIRDEALKITGLTLKGEKFNCSLKGNVLLADDIRESQIDLTATVEIPIEKSKRITLAITGTLGNPKTRLM
jgi:type II secretion system protein N